MRRLSCIYFILGMILSFSVALPLLAQEKKESEEVYTIKEGDTLWEISAKFLKDPFLWPKLWQRNPYITNPHWIYTGKRIRLTPLEEAKKEGQKREASEAKPEAEKKEPKMTKVEKMEETSPPEKKVETVVQMKPVEEKPPFFQELRSAGFFSNVDYRGIGIILESKEGKVVLANGDVCYVTFKSSEPVRVGNRYTAFRQTEIGYPEVDKKLGYRYNITGNIEIIDQYGDYYTAIVLEAFQDIFKGDHLRAYSKERMEFGQGKK